MMWKAVWCTCVGMQNGLKVRRTGFIFVSHNCFMVLDFVASLSLSFHIYKMGIIISLFIGVLFNWSLDGSPGWVFYNLVVIMM